MYKLLTFIFILSFPFIAIAEEASPLEYSKKFKSQLDELNELMPDEFLQKIDSYRESLERYVEHKKRVCNGEFSTIVLGVTNVEKTARKKNKLTRAERVLCFRELKGFQVTLVNNMYSARKRFLDYLHSKRITELEKARNKTIKSLQGSFSQGQQR